MIVTIAAAGLAGLVLQQVSVLMINWATQQTGDQGALTRFTWANALYLLPYAVLAAPLLQMVFPRLAAAAEAGEAQVRAVLAETGPAIVAMAWLGAALLVATAVPVARVFVLGPGSGRTAALAWPIVAFAPAVVGFTMLGLASRTLLAQHHGRAAGLTTASAWAVVIIGVLAVQTLVGAAWLVPAIAASVSLGMVVGALVGWLLVRRSHRDRGALGLTRPMLAGSGAAVVAAGLCAVVGGVSRRRRAGARDAGRGRPGGGVRLDLRRGTAADRPGAPRSAVEPAPLRGRRPRRPGDEDRAGADGQHRAESAGTSPASLPGCRPGAMRCGSSART